MKPAGSRRDRIRAQLADLKMPGALEALDEVLTGVDGGGMTASEAIEQLLGAQIMLRTAQPTPSGCHAFEPTTWVSRPSTTSDGDCFQPSMTGASRSTVSTSSASWSVLENASLFLDLPSGRRQDRSGDQELVAQFAGVAEAFEGQSRDTALWHKRLHHVVSLPRGRKDRRPAGAAHRLQQCVGREPSLRGGQASEMRSADLPRSARSAVASLEEGLELESFDRPMSASTVSAVGRSSRPRSKASSP